MDIKEAKELYKISQNAKYGKYKLCRNCKFKDDLVSMCEVKRKVILIGIGGIFCKYFTWK